MYPNNINYQSYQNGMPMEYRSQMNQGNMNPNDERFGGFVFPFLLGGVTGAALAPAFYRPPYSPYYNRPPYYYGPYPRFY